MPRADYKYCKRCGRHASEAGLLSHTRLCLDCSKLTYRESYADLTTHTGPVFQRWRVRIAASVGAVILDDPRQSV